MEGLLRVVVTVFEVVFVKLFCVTGFVFIFFVLLFFKMLVDRGGGQ